MRPFGFPEAVEDSLAATAAVVPSLWPLEVANALLVGERRKRTTEAKVSVLLTLLQSLSIETDDDMTLRARHESRHLAAGWHGHGFAWPWGTLRYKLLAF